MRVFVEGIGLLGPGLNGWQASCRVLSGAAPYVPAPTNVPLSDMLPAAERRRTGVSVKLALAAGCEAFKNAGRDAAATATVFTSSDGDGDNTHQIYEALALPQRELSPTRFHNSVHNAAAGYWSIAVHSHHPSTSLCCYDASFAAGLLETAVQVTVEGKPAALIAYDEPYPEPLHSVRPLAASFGVAFVLTPSPTSHTRTALDVNFAAVPAEIRRMTDAGLEAVRANVPAARSLPLLAALARGESADVVLEYAAVTCLRIAVTPCA
jgi:hypothetical protein